MKEALYVAPPDETGAELAAAGEVLTADVVGATFVLRTAVGVLAGGGGAAAEEVGLGAAAAADDEDAGRHCEYHGLE